MGADSKFISNQKPLLSLGHQMRNIQIGVVCDINDPESLGRIKVKISGPPQKGGDEGTAIADLPWAYPMLPKFFGVTPKVDEGVFVLIFGKDKTHSDRLYFGPIISELSNLNKDSVNTTALSPFTFAMTNPKVDYNRVTPLTGVFPKPDDIAIQGRDNTDLILRKNEILIRAGKFTKTNGPTENNPFSFQFNDTDQGFIQIKYNIPLEKPQQNLPARTGSVTNIIGSKINLLTHRDGSPTFNLMNQEEQITNDEILNILSNAHPLPFGDLLVEYLKLLKNALLNHVHNNNGIPPTDLFSSGEVQAVKEFKSKAEDLENRMLSKNIRIN